MPIYVNSWVVILSQHGIVKKHHRPMCADDAQKIYNKYQQEELIKSAEKQIEPKITGSFMPISNKWIEGIIKNCREDLQLITGYVLNTNYTSEYGNTKIELLHSSQT